MINVPVAKLLSRLTASDDEKSLPPSDDECWQLTGLFLENT